MSSAHAKHTHTLNCRKSKSSVNCPKGIATTFGDFLTAIYSLWPDIKGGICMEKSEHLLQFYSLNLPFLRIQFLNPNLHRILYLWRSSPNLNKPGNQITFRSILVHPGSSRFIQVHPDLSRFVQVEMPLWRSGYCESTSRMPLEIRMLT